MAYLLPLDKVFPNWDRKRDRYGWVNKNYHIVQIYGDSEIFKKGYTTKEFRDWMKTNIKGGWYKLGRTFHENDVFSEDFLFTCEDSAILFQLKWG